jgi:hypothetical protein
MNLFSSLCKRKLYFILQLLNNKATRELVAVGIHNSLSEIFEKIGISEAHKSLGKDRYQGLIRSLVLRKIDDINQSEKVISESKIVRSVEYLLENRSAENHDTLQYILDPRRCGRG